MAEQAVINRAELMALLQGRGVQIKDGTIPDYFESDPDGQESRGRGWYYQTSAGAWIYLGGNLDDAKKVAMTAPTTQGIVGKPPKALQRTWTDVSIQYATVLVLPAVVGATTGALRKEGRELEAAAVDVGVALIGGALMEKGTSEAARRAGAALLGGAAADAGQEYLSGPLLDAYKALFPDKTAKGDLAKLDEAENAAQAKAQEQAKQEQQVPEPAKATG
jgi:hypothetical protein